MRSGSSAHDGRGWSPAQHPHSGRGPQPEREDVPFGSEFDSGEYRQLVESSNGYAADGRYPQDAGYAHTDPRQGRQQYQQPGAGYQQAHRRPADDYGYGDPGYADPSYDGPRGSGGYQGYRNAPVPPAPIAPAAPAPVPAAPAPPAPGYQPPPAYPPAGYQQPWPGSAPAADQVYPVTGAQEVYRENPAQEEPRRYEERRYEEPRYEQPRPDDRQAAAADPRLAGIRYDELRYDDAGSGGEEHADSRYDEPLDDDAWYAELRRGGPAFQQQPSRPSGPNPPARPDLYQQAPGQDWPSGPPQNPGNSGNGGHGGYGPRMSAVPAPGVGSGPMVGLSRAPGAPSAASPAQASPAALGFQAAPVFEQPSSVGVLTPPAGSRYQTRVDVPQAFSTQQPRLAAAPPVPAAPSATAAMPAMTGPDTAAWDIETEDDELDALEQYWQEDDAGDGGYSALLDDLEEDDEPVRVRKDKGKGKDSKAATTVKRIGRRRGGSNDHKLLLGLVGIVAVAGGAIFGITKFAFPHGNGPAHELVTPTAVGSYQWAPKLEQQVSLGPLIKKFRAGLGGSATNVVAREYESGSAVTGSSPQLVIVIGGHLPNQSPATSLHNFTAEFKDAQVVSAGPMGGAAACTSASTVDGQAMCVWFDNDSVGAIISPTMSAAKLDQAMLQFRPYVEHLVK